VMRSYKVFKIASSDAFSMTLLNKRRKDLISNLSVLFTDIISLVRSRKRVPRRFKKEKCRDKGKFCRAISRSSARFLRVTFIRYVFSQFEYLTFIV
jgi:hypothetical protein